MYNVTYDVKYNDMFLEFDPIESDKTVLMKVIEDLYKHDLIAVCGDNKTNTDWNDCLIDISPKLFENAKFAKIMDDFSRTRYCVYYKLGKDKVWNLTMLLCFDTFHILHKCIQNVHAQPGHIDRKNLDDLAEYVRNRVLADSPLHKSGNNIHVID